MRITWKTLPLAAILWATSASADPVTPAKIAAFEHGLHRKTGDVAIFAAGAKLHLGDRFYFLDAEEAKKVLVDVWGNPPTAVTDVLGLVLPADRTIIDNVWGAVITYNPSGYVSDTDADSADYGKIFADLKSGEVDRNAARTKAGYPASHLIGWAEPPSYDRTTHSMVWARDFRIAGDTMDSLNYDVRLLGRRGVLSMNMISDMAHLPEVRAAAKTFGKTAEFVPGAAYANFDSSKDKEAGYGLAGLVAAGVGVAAAKKLGVLALVLGFGKKFLILFAVAGAAIVRYFKKLFRRGGDGEDGGAPA
jgi:uncharacterized membrane-anchored protein